MKYSIADTEKSCQPLFHFLYLTAYPAHIIFFFLHSQAVQYTVLVKISKMCIRDRRDLAKVEAAGSSPVSRFYFFEA